MHARQLFRGVPVLILFVCGRQLFAQKDLFQLSGIISEDEKNMPIAFASVEVLGTYHMVHSSIDGFFSCVVGERDSIVFSALGYKTKMYIVPDSVNDAIFSIAVLLTKDTIELEGVEIYPWPDRSEFRDAFLSYTEAKDLYQVGPIPGIKGPDQIDTVPPAPVLYKNPISFIYEEMVVPIQWKKKKKNKAKELPKWEN